MVDVVDPATRSRMMAGIRGKNTKPELLVRSALHKRGFRFALHSAGFPGRPDIVMPKWRVAIFVHGCFWHWHGCHLSKLPSTNVPFWKTKLGSNQYRDELSQLSLISAGWRTAVIWECALRGQKAMSQLPELLNRLDCWIRSSEEPLALELPEPVVQATPQFLQQEQ
jgi:DNA mismatch endonuclease (patch repair protein)